MSLHVPAQRVSPGGMVIPPGKIVNGWGLYDKRQALYAETYTTPQVAHVNHLRNTTPDNNRFMHWYYRLVHDTPVVGPFAYGGWGIIHKFRVPSDLGLGFKVHFCHRANFENYLLQVQQGNAITIWKESRKEEGGYGKVIARAPYNVRLGAQFEYRVEIDGKGGVMARVDNTEISVKDTNPITSGTVGYRLDRVDVSFGADGFSL